MEGSLPVQSQFTVGISVEGKGDRLVVRAEDALIAALLAGRLGGAGLDVFSVEPLPAGHKFGGLPNVLLTPHVAGATAQSKRNILVNSITNVARVARGEAPKFVVSNPRPR